LFRSLAGNAIKFTEHGHIAVEVRLLERDANRARLRFSVTDTGIGIAADKLEQIFQSFTQADASITRLHGGSGLGLSISKRLVELMDGEIGVNSEPGRGSEFWFTIPLQVDTGHADDAVSSQALEVLLADDHLHALRQLANTARSLGWHAQEATTGTRALTLARQRLGQGLPPHDAIVLDLNMPGMGGLAVCRAIRSDSRLRDTAVVIMAGTGLREEIQRSSDATLIDALLTKPVTASGLYNAVSTARARRNRHDPAMPVVATGQPHLAGLSILVVDDSDINQMVARRILELDGASVAVAANGQEAVDCLRSRPEGFDIVLMDVQMPVMDGLSATRCIREELGLKDLPVIALTAGATEMQRSEAIGAGMNDFISKPFEAKRMIEIIQGIASGRARHVAKEPATAVGGDDFPDIDGIDTAEADQRLGHDGQLLLALLEQFLAENAQTIALCRSDLAEGNAASARKRIHKLRGTAANLSAKDIFEQASELENAIAAGLAAGQAGELLDRLEHSLDTLRASAGSGQG
ncbi:MAG: response regulator, partial [Zoogloea sp.]|nr:response regulator [Zoogloea sp.]